MKDYKILLLFTAIFLLTACGSSSDDPPQEEVSANSESNEGQQEVTSAHSIPNEDHQETSGSSVDNEIKTNSNIGWGAKKLDNSQRPDHSWLANFNGVTPIPVTHSLEEALDLCTPNAYCVLEVNQLELSKTFYFNRSKTKIIGKAGNRMTYPVSTDIFQAFLELGREVEEVVFENLNLDGQSINHAEEPITGILVFADTVNKVALLNNHIHHLHSESYGHGIAIYGRGGTENSAVKNVIIDGNNIHDMRTGSGESLVVNGNVKHWEVTHNQISRVNNIAIDIIGGDGTSPAQTLNGRRLPGKLDAARLGFVEGNTVNDMSTATNAAYGSEHTWAGGIYIDGAKQIVMVDNNVIGSEWAYNIGAENCVTVSHIWVENNTASNSYFGDFDVGGYAKGGYKNHPDIQCDPEVSIDDNEGHGNVENMTVKNNHFNTSTPRIDTFFFGERILKSIIIHEGIGEQHPDGVVSGDQSSIRIVE